MPSDKPLSGKTALVTGSARNIGRAIAVRLAQEGANVIINGVSDKPAAEAVRAEVEALGVNAITVMGNIGVEADCRAMVDAAVPLGGVDILILNASQRGQKPFLEMSHTEFRNVVDLSLDGAFHLTQAAIPQMQLKGWGRIVALGGISWEIGTKNRVHNLAGKAGLTGFIRGVATEFAETGITANLVSPGFIDTVRPASAGTRPKLNVEIPVGRLGEVAEIAEAVAYLCSPNAGYTTGQTVHVNGGVYLA